MSDRDARAKAWQIPECSRASCHQVGLQKCDGCGYVGCARHMHYDRSRRPRCPVCGGAMRPARPGE